MNQNQQPSNNMMPPNMNGGMPTNMNGRMPPNMNGRMPPNMNGTNMNGEIVGDVISNLPVDKSIPSHNEIKLVDTLFKKQKSILDKLLYNLKDILIVGILFVFFSLPHVDTVIKKILPVTDKSTYILIGIKALVLMLLFFIIQNFDLSRKN
jgi:hypothetical protein